MLPKKRRNRFKFTEKKHSLRGMIATGLSLVSIIAFAIIINKAFRSEGGLSAYFGSAGIFSMLIAIVALVVAIVSLKEEDSFSLFKRTGLLGSVIACLMWIGTLIEGLI